MSEHYDFHYQPTGSGAISGQQVLQQTEDAINELGDYVNDNVGGAMDVAQQALETAQNAEQDAQTALDTANSFSGAIQSAQQDASTALSTAQTAQTTASNANNTAIQAQQDASSAVTTANNASGQVSTLSGTVTTLGQRVTTAEGNIGQNTSDISSLTTRVGTAEGNITTLQNDVSIAQGNASSAMATAGTVKQQAYVFRYSSTALVASSTNSNTLLDNTDNLKVGDKVIDSSGVLFSITAIDTANSTFTIGSALIDLAKDSDVVHTSGNETITGTKTFTDNISLKSLTAEYTVTGASISVTYSDKNGLLLAQNKLGNYQSGIAYNKLSIFAYDSNNQLIERTLTYSSQSNTFATAFFRPDNDNIVSLGTTGKRWSGVYSTSYYYGNDNVEFSTKFVTTDTAQTVSGAKTFSSNTIIYNSDSTANTPSLILQSSKILVGDRTSSDTQSLVFNGGSSWISRVDSYKDNGGTQNLQLKIRTKDNDNNLISSMCRLRIFTDNFQSFEPEVTNVISLGRSGYKWKDVQTNLVNGITPSSLSLPSGTLADQIDISSYFANTGSGDTNSYTASANGWIYLHVTVCRTLTAYIQNGTDTLYSDYRARSSDGQIRIMLPIQKNNKFTSQWITSTTVSITKAVFIPCQGNV